MTNMMPQAPRNNQHTWANLEDYCRTLPAEPMRSTLSAGSYGMGGTGSNGGATTTLDQGRVTVPARTWKVVVVLPVGDNDAARVTATPASLPWTCPTPTPQPRLGHLPHQRRRHRGRHRLRSALGSCPWIFRRLLRPRSIMVLPSSCVLPPKFFQNDIIVYMTSFYKSAWKLGQWPAFLVCLFFFNAQQSWGQTPYQLATGPYTENFDAIGTSATTGWGPDFASGIGAAPFSKAAPNPILPNTNNVFVAGSSGGVQKGAGAIVLLATGTTAGQNASAFDLNLDFTGTSAGSISLDWAQVNNSTGDRGAIFKLQTNTGDQDNFVDLAGSTVVITNNVPADGKLVTVPLPAAFAGKANAKIRFFIVTSSVGTNGSRPKISIDNVQVTTSPGDTPAPTTAITTTASTFSSPYCVSEAAGSAPFNVAYTSSGTFTGTSKYSFPMPSGAFLPT